VRMHGSAMMCMQATPIRKQRTRYDPKGNPHTLALHRANAHLIPPATLTSTSTLNPPQPHPPPVSPHPPPSSLALHPVRRSTSRSSQHMCAT